MPKAKAKLFEEGSDDEQNREKGVEDDLNLKVNEEYAKKYEKWRTGEELQKLKDKYGTTDLGSGDEEDDSDSDSESSEEEEPELLASDKDWLRTLALIKSKDSRIYDPSFTFYKPPAEKKEEKGEEEKAPKKKKNEKAMYLRDYERKMILEAGGKPVDEEEDEGIRRRIDDSEPPLPYNEEQLKLKQSFQQFLADESGGEDEPLLTAKKKSSEEMKEEEATYLQWLKGRPVDDVDPEDAKELDPLRRYWNDPALPEGERFLRDFIFQGTATKFDEKTNERVDEKGQVIDHVDLNADEEEVEKQSEFERKYNFRYEEPDPEFIKSYPRTVSESLRRKDDSRARKREEKRKRKVQEDVERREDLRHLKKLKRNEINEKLRKLRHIAGGADVEEEEGAFGAFRPEDLDGDYDPEAHEKMLERVFNDGYYNVAEDLRPDIGLEEEDCAEYGDDIKADAGSDWEDDVEPKSEPQDEKPSTSTAVDDSVDPQRPWRRNKSRAAMEIAKEKPVFNPEEKTFDDYLDEYYKLDYEDVVGGLPCRFKYRKVEPIDFGLDAKEVIKARDKELNGWVSIKRVVQYRRPEDDVKERKRYEQKAKNEKKKYRIIPSLAEQQQGGEQKQGKKSGKTKPTVEYAKNGLHKTEKKHTVTSTDSTVKVEVKEQKQHKQTNKSKPSNDTLAGLTDDRLRAYGLEPKKFKYTKHRFLQQPGGNNNNSSGATNNSKKQKQGKARPVFA